MMTSDEQYLLAPARYVDLNPVRAKLVKGAEEYPWSSAAAHLNGENDILVNVEPCQLWLETVNVNEVRVPRISK